MRIEIVRHPNYLFCMTLHCIFRDIDDLNVYSIRNDLERSLKVAANGSHFDKRRQFRISLPL